MVLTTIARAWWFRLHARHADLGLAVSLSRDGHFFCNASTVSNCPARSHQCLGTRVLFPVAL